MKPTVQITRPPNVNWNHAIAFFESPPHRLNHRAMAGRLAGGFPSFLMLAAMIRLFPLWRTALTKSGFTDQSSLTMVKPSETFSEDDERAKFLVI